MSRDALIQENINRATQASAQRGVVTPTRDNAGKGVDSLTSLGAPRISFLGGNFEVYRRLESIDFKAAGGDGGMRGSVAYLRKWERKGTADVNAISLSSVNGVDYQDALNFQIRAKMGGLTSSQNQFFGIPSSRRFAPLAPSTPINTSPFTSITTTGLVTVQAFGTQFIAQTPLTPLSLQNRYRPYPYIQTPSIFGTSAFLPVGQTLGQIFPANPNGGVVQNFLSQAANMAVGFGLQSLLRPVGFKGSHPSFLMSFPPQRPPNKSTSNATEIKQGGIKPFAPMMWQFLFNPSELELEMGPEFKSSETWGVSDKANSGQPLHWSHNKNAQLKFNSVLLNGYVFGRKVEQLEQGLIELFMARDGAGQHGPHVLEFVWGRRVFGPCVIKNINIKEKMWDEGEVVNAELSFTLEQVPEWTVNDGAFVDVARPGRRPLQEEVAANLGQTTGTSGQTNTGSADTSPPTPGGGENSSQKPSSKPPTQPSNSFLPQNECDAGRRTIANFSLASKLSQINLIEYAFGASQEKQMTAVNKYVGTYNTFTSVLNTLPLDPKCKSRCINTGEAITKNGDISCARACSDQAINLLTQRYNTGKCLAQTVLPGTR